MFTNGSKSKNLKVVLLISTFLLINVVDISFCKAQSGPITQLPGAVTVFLGETSNLNQDIVNQIEAINGVTVIAYNAGVSLVISMPYDEFIDGVVFSEIGGDNQPPEALKAQAVAARSFTASVQSRAFRQLDGLTYDVTDSTQPLTIVDENQTTFIEPLSLEAFKPYDTDVVGGDSGAGDSVSETAHQALFAFNRTTSVTELTLAKFSDAFGDNSEDEIFYPAFPGFWNFPPYLKRRDDTGATRDVPAFNAEGLSQQGALTLAREKGWDYQGILNYFYAVSPPIIRAIDIYQDNDSDANLRYSAQWDDVTTSSIPPFNVTTIDGMNISDEPSSRELTTQQNDSLIAGTTAVILLTANESIDTRENLQVFLSSGTNAVTATGVWNDFSSGNFPTWEGTFIVPSGSSNCPVSIIGQGVSISINPFPSGTPNPSISSTEALDSDASTPATLSLSTGPSVWNGYEAGPVTNFAFQVSTFPRAYVQGVTVSQNATPIYQAQWPLAPPPSPTVEMIGTPTPYPVTILANAPTVNTNVPALFGVGTHFDFYFNNPMNVNPTMVPTVEALFYVKSTPTPVSTWIFPVGSWGLDGQTYSADAPSTLITTSEAGDSVTLSISGAKDANNRPMDGDPHTIAYQLKTGYDLNGWAGFEAEADTANAFFITTPTPTFTPTPNPTPAQTPTTLKDVLSALSIFPIARGPFKFFETDPVGDIYACGFNTNSDPNHGYMVQFNLKTFKLNDTDLGLFENYEPISYDISPNGLSAVMASCYSTPTEPTLWYSEINSNGPIVGGSPNCSPLPNDQVKNIAFDGQGNLYVLYMTFVEDTEVSDTLITQSPNDVLSSRFLPPGCSVIRDKYWNVTLYGNGLQQQLGQGIQTASLPLGEGENLALLPKCFSFLEPSVAWAQEVNPDTPSGASPQMQVSTGDGRVYVLGTDGLTVYGYDTNNNLLCQLSIQEGPNDPFMGVVISYAPGGGPGGTLAFMDDYSNVRVAQIPLPPNFTPLPTNTPLPTPTATFTFTPTPTNTNLHGYTSTFTFTHTPTSTPTISPTSTSTNLNGYTSTFTPTPPGPLYCNVISSIGTDGSISGLAVDSQGNLYAGDTDYDEVDVFDAQGNPVTQWGPPANGVNHFDTPNQLAIDGNNHLYMTDDYRDMVFVFDTAGNPITQWGGVYGTGTGQFEDPTGIAVNAAGTTVYVVDSEVNRVQAFTGQGSPITQWGTEGDDGQGSFDFPTGVALDNQGQVYVTSEVPDWIEVFNGTGKFLNQWNTSTWAPYPDLLSVDNTVGKIYLYSALGELGISDLSGNEAGVMGGIGYTSGIAAPQDGTFYLALNGQGNIQHFGPCGQTPYATPTPTITWTPTPTETPTFFATFTFTATPNGDAYSNWLQATDAAGFGQRAHHQALYFNNHYWVIGGEPFGNENGGNPANDVWSSSDGIHWSEAVTAAAFPPRADFGAVVFGGKMWVMGAVAVYNGGWTYLSDVWSSLDGVNWTETKAQAPWGYRTAFTVTAFNGQMWVIGGEDLDNNDLNDVWSSPDGVNWTKQTASAAFPGRFYHQCLAYNGQLWVMGGSNFFNEPLNDVWSSPDGVNWTEATANASWPPRWGFTAQVDPISNQMVVLGGGYPPPNPVYSQHQPYISFNDVYHSSDGINWTASTYAAPFPGRAYGAAATDNNHIWITGGDPLLPESQSENNYSYDLRDAWYSNFAQVPTFTPTSTPTPDGNAVWTQAVGDTAFIPRSNPGLTAFQPSTGSWAGQNLLWMAGGTNSDIGPLGDVWNSPDGVNWRLATDNTPFDEQTGLVTSTFNGNLWVFNAIDWDNGQYQVFSSPNGVNWNLADAQAPFSQVIGAYVLNNQLWVMDSSCGNASRLFSSPDGMNWTLESQVPILGVNNTMAFNGYIWIFGGFWDCGGPTPITDETVWKTSDGVHWSQVSGNLPYAYEATSYTSNYEPMSFGGGALFIPNGINGNNALQDQWFTQDGIHWNQVAVTTAYIPRTNFSAAAFNNQMWAVGGQDSNGNDLNDVWTAPALGYTPASTWTPGPGTPTSTFTPSPTFTGSITNSPTNSFTPTPSPAVTSTPTPTATPTISPTPTVVSITGQGWLQGAPVGRAFPNRQGQTATAFNGSIWVIGGGGADIWDSPDGINWNLSTVLAPFGTRTGQAAVSFNGALWMIGGQTSQGVTNDVWNSLDGVSWTQVTASASFPPRSGHQVVIFNGQMWVMGGDGLADVWSSTNGINWDEEPRGPFATTSGFQAMALNSQIWVVGGIPVTNTDVTPNPNFYGYQSMAWSTSDGVHWSTGTSLPFEYRTGFAGTVANGQMWIMGGHGASGAVKNDVWSSGDGTDWTEETAAANFSPRQGLSGLVFNPSSSPQGNNALWIVGGTDLSGNNNGNSWYSPLAPYESPTPTPTVGPYGNWTQATANAGFPQRADQASVTFNNRMWVIGGGNDSEFFNDTWSSTDGANWTQQTVSTGFSPRIDPGAAAFNGKIWVVGGQNFNDSLNNDVWSSPDGVNWTEAVTQAPFSPRTGSSLMVQNLGNGPELWLVGGLDQNDNVLSDIWVSSDGMNWSSKTPSSNSGTAYPLRAYQAGAPYNNSLWVAGGVPAEGDLLNDAWYTDGNHWYGPTTFGTQGRQDASAGIMDNFMFVIGGTLDDGTEANDVWYLNSSSNWTMATSSANFSPRSDHSSVAFNNKLWVIAGWDGNEYLNDTWYTNSLVPTETPTSTPTPTPLSTAVSIYCNEVSSSSTDGSINGLALDTQGNLYAADADTDQVDVFDSHGNAVTQWGPPSNGLNQFIYPMGLAIDGNNHLYMTDYLGDMVYVFDTAGHPITQWGGSGSGTGQFQAPFGIAVNSAGTTVYVADLINDRVASFNGQGEPITQWGTTGDNGNGTFDLASGVALDNQGRVYVESYIPSLIEVFDGNGNFLNQRNISSWLPNPLFLSVDNTTSQLYITTINNTLGISDLSGNEVGVISGTGGSIPQAPTYGGVAAPQDGTFYAALDDQGVINRLGSCSTIPYPTPTPTITLSPTQTPLLTPTPTLTLTPSPVPGTIYCNVVSSSSTDGSIDGLALDTQGNLYAADVDNNQVDIFDPHGNAVTQWGPPSNGQNPFIYPMGLAIDGNDHLYMTDYEDDMVYVFDTAGNPITQWGGSGNGIGQFQAPWGIAVNSAGTTVYVADEANNRVEVFNGQGVPVTQWGTAGDDGNGTFDYATGLALDNQGRVYVESFNPSLIEVFDGSGNFLNQWNTSSWLPNPVFLSVDSTANRVCVATQGSGLGISDLSGNEVGVISGVVSPGGVAAPQDGTFYAAVNDHENIERLGPCSSSPYPTPTTTFTPSPTLTPTPGPSPIPIFCNLISSSSTDSAINGMATDGQGNVYAADGDTDQVDVFDPQGNPITQWGPSGQNQFINPMGLAVDGNNHLYLTDNYNNQVYVFDTAGDAITQWGGGGYGPGQFEYPIGIAVNSNGTTVYVADSGNNRVQVLDGNGNPITEWGTYGDAGGGTFDYMTGLTLDNQGRIYVASYNPNWIEVFDGSGNFLDQWNTGSWAPNPVMLAVDSTANQVYIEAQNVLGISDLSGNEVGVVSGIVSPGGVAAPQDGTLWVGANNLGVIERLGPCSQTPYPTPTPTLTPILIPTLTPLPPPVSIYCNVVSSSSTDGSIDGLALDTQGNLYAADVDNNQVDIFDPHGNAVTQWGPPSNGQNPFIYPMGLAIDGNDHLYMTDYEDDMVYVFDTAGNPITQWGGSGNGIGQFQAPWGIAVNSAGTTVYVADEANNRVEVFNGQGVPVTQWGTAGDDGNGTFDYATGLALDNQGRVYVESFNPSLIEVFDGSGNFLNQWNTSSWLPNPVFLSVDSTANRVCVATQGSGLGISDLSGNEVGVISGVASPGGVAAPQDGTFYAAADDLNNIERLGSCGQAPYPTPTPTYTLTLTGTYTFTPSLTATFTPTNTGTETPTQTPTNTTTFTGTNTPTNTATNSATYTTTNTATNTLTNTATYTTTNTPTNTTTDTPTSTTTKTSTNTATYTTTKTTTNTPTKTTTSTPTNTTTNTSTNTATSTGTNTPTNTATSTPTKTVIYTPTNNATNTTTKTTTNTATNSPTASPTLSPTNTRTSTASLTPSQTPTRTETKTATKTPTPANSPTKTSTFTVTGTSTKTATLTNTATKTFTVTKTYTPTITPTPSPTTACGTNTSALALLEEYTSSCGSNSVYHLFAVVNNGAAVTLSDLTIKFWPYDTSGVSLVGSISTGGCIWNPTCSHNVTGTTISALNFSPACGPSTTQMANWEMTVSTTDNTVLSGGTSWVGLQTLVNRSDNQPFVPGTSYWYSPCVMASTYSTNSHYAIYLKGNLVTASGGIPPSCRPLATCTPSGGQGAIVADLARMNGNPTLTPTPIPPLLASVVAAPNITNGQQPIRLLTYLTSQAKVSLAIFTVSGEQVYGTETEGSAGLNTIVWNLQNNGSQPVASGLYLFVLRVHNGASQETKVGKIAIIR